MAQRILPYGIILLICLPILLPLYSIHILGSADNLAHLFRIVNLDYALGQGYIWPRWAALEGHGFGAPIFNFNYVLPYYICVALWRIAGDLLIGSQLYMILALIASAWSMYAFLNHFFSKSASVVGSIAYVYMPYHLMTVYLYSGYGEALAYVWVPLIGLAVTKLIQDMSMKAGISVVVYVSLLILTHNLSAAMTMGIVATIIPVLLIDAQKRHKALTYIVVALCASLFVTTWFWLPAVTEQHLTKLGILFEKETALRGHFFDLIAPVWEHSVAALRLEPPGYYSYAVGIPAVVMAVVALCMLLYAQTVHPATTVRGKRIHWLGVFFISWYIVSFFMTRKISEPLWDVLPARLNFLSYPYRFFFIQTFATAGITAFVIDRVWYRYKNITRWIVCLFVASLFVWQGYIYAHPAIDTFAFGPSYFTYTQTVRSAPYTYKNMGYIEFIPTTADSDFVNGLDMLPSTALPKIEIVSGVATANIISQKAQDILVEVQAKTQSTAQVNILYFPGWAVRIDDVSVPVTIDAVGRMNVAIPAGSHRVHISFQNTPIRTFSETVSISSVLLIGGYMVLHTVRKRRRMNGKFLRRS